MHEQKTSPKAHFTFPYSVTSLLHTTHYFILRTKAKVIIYDTISKNILEIIEKEQSCLFIHEPYIVVRAIGQFLHLYPDQSAENVEIMKISKLEVKAMLRYGKGVLMGGYNRSPLPGGKHTDRRSIYYLDHLTTKHKNKPNITYNLPSNTNPVTDIRTQSPYLVCVCAPYVHVLNIYNQQLLLTVENTLSSLHLLQGRYSNNQINMLAISNNRLVSLDVERVPLFGVEVNSHPTQATTFCQSKQGYIYASHKNSIFQYHPHKHESKPYLHYPQGTNILQLYCTVRNSLLALCCQKQGQIFIDVFVL